MNPLLIPLLRREGNNGKKVAPRILVVLTVLAIIKMDYKGVYPIK